VTLRPDFAIGLPLSDEPSSGSPMGLDYQGPTETCVNSMGSQARPSRNSQIKEVAGQIGGNTATQLDPQGGPPFQR
jgi:hypothetical protein